MMPILSAPHPGGGARLPPDGARTPRSPRPGRSGTIGTGGRNLSFLLRRDEHASESGVQLPLLAPMLAGLRLRCGAAGMEFILPNPSGGRGVYVTSWPVVTGFATPSLHDTLLVGRLSGCRRVDPAAVRDAARWAAREGHAGAAAAEAAHDVDGALRIAALRLGGQLLMGLARRAGFSRPEDAARCLSPSGFHQLAGRLGWHGPDLAEGLRLVSAHYATVTIGGNADVAGTIDAWSSPFPPRTAGSGRWGRLAALVQRFRTALAEEQSGSHGADGAAIGRIIAAADQCLARADRLLPEIEIMQNNPMPLLEAWRDGQPDTAGWLDEMEAAFDGWARVCLLWFDPDTARRRQAVVAEIAVLTRTVGNLETRPQVEMPADPAVHARLLLERNERLCARELLLDTGGA